jgi:hypothetical protein
MRAIQERKVGLGFLNDIILCDSTMFHDFPKKVEKVFIKRWTYPWTSDERTNHFVFFVGRGDGNIFDKNIFLASRKVQRLGTQPKFELSWSIA